MSKWRKAFATSRSDAAMPCYVAMSHQPPQPCDIDPVSTCPATGLITAKRKMMTSLFYDGMVAHA